MAVVSATAYKSDSNGNLDLAVEIATAASRAAPRFTEVIANAVSFAPSISRIDGAAGQIRAAAFAAAKAGGGKPRRSEPREYVSAPPPRRVRPAPVETYPPSDDNEPLPPVRPKARSRTTVASRAPAVTEPTISDDPARYPQPSTPEVVGEYATNTPIRENSYSPPTSLDNNSAFHAKADVSIRHDDNVFLQKTDKTSDEIVSVSPGVDFGFGQNSLTHGTLAYQVDFVRYVHHSSPSTHLSHGLADFGYSSETLNLAASAAYNQSNQNDRDVLVDGSRAIIRTNSLTTAVTGEGSLSPKVSLKTGATYAKTSYPTPQTPPPSAKPPTPLIGNKEFGVPLNVYYKVTPKIDLSAGATYRTVTPDNGGTGSHDWYYNVGARGEFTPKLHGEFSVGERKRQTENNTDDSLLGFNSALTFDLTPKTSAILSLSRDFSASATGESLHNSTYGLRLATTFSPQWEASTGISYRKVNYGEQLFRAVSTTTKTTRQDDYWEGNLSVSYIFSSWLTTSAGYTLRNNNSTVSGVEFSNSLLSLVMGLRY